MKKLLLSLLTVMLSAGYALAQNTMILKTNKKSGERITFTINVDGNFTIDGAEGEPVNGFGGYTVNGPLIKITGNVLEFSAPYSGITEVDVSNMPVISILDLYGNPISDINLSKNDKLSFLGLGNTEVKSLDLKACPNLLTLNINNSKIESVDFSKSSKLTTLLAQKAGLKSLDLSGATKLEVLDCSANNLGNIDFSKLTNLIQLGCALNGMTELNVSMLENLEVLNCNGNKLKEVNISGLSQIQEVGCAENQVESLDVTGCKSLFGLAIYGNKIGNAAMTSLIEQIPTHPVVLDSYLTVINSDYAEESNECTKSNVKKAEAKNWGVYDYKSGMTQGFHGDPYEGIDDEMVGIDNADAEGFVVYKAYADGRIYVSGIAEGTLVSLVDMAGRTVMQAVAGADAAVLDASNLHAGVYVIKAGDNSRKVRI